MRARNIKPGLCTNEILGTADPLVHLLFACLPMVADRDGKIEDRPLRIKAAIFPYRDVKIDSLLSWLEKNGFIERYECAGIKVIYICGFRKHQSPHHTERMSELPDKPLNNSASGEITMESTLHDGGNPPDSLIPDSLIPDSPPPPVLVKMPYDKIPQEWMHFCIDEMKWTTPIAEDVFETFREYWKNGKGKNTKREGWFATWRTWCRSQMIKSPVQFNQKPKPQRAGVRQL